MNAIASMMREMADLERLIQVDTEIRALVTSAGWKRISDILNDDVVNRINRLCDPKCPPDETSTLRAEIATIRRFLLPPLLDEESFSRSVRRVQDLRARVKRLQDQGLGLPPDEISAIQAEIRQAAQALQGAVP